MIFSMMVKLSASLFLLLGAFLSSGQVSGINYLHDMLFGVTRADDIDKSLGDPECTEYEHVSYGFRGQCVATSECPGGKYVSNRCPSYPENVKCCFTVGTDEQCATADPARYGQVGVCIDKNDCPNNIWSYFRCPSAPANFECCYSLGYLHDPKQRNLGIGWLWNRIEENEDD